MVGPQCQASTGTGQTTGRTCCDNFLYGFKGAPPARHARAEPNQGIESRGREVPEWNAIGASVTTWSSAGNDEGLLRARGVGLSRPAARERSGRATDAGRLAPLP